MCRSVLRDVFRWTGRSAQDDVLLLCAGSRVLMYRRTCRSVAFGVLWCSRPDDMLRCTG